MANLFGAKAEWMEYALRAWFPAPEFSIGVEYAMEKLAICAVVHHCQSRIVLSQLINEDYIAQDAQVDALATLSHSMHYELCRQGYSKPFPSQDEEFEQVRALCYIAGMEFRCREVQGHETRLLVYLTRDTPGRTLWVEPVQSVKLVNSFGWWQQHVSKLVHRSLAT